MSSVPPCLFSSGFQALVLSSYPNFPQQWTDLRVVDEIKSFFTKLFWIAVLYHSSRNPKTVLKTCSDNCFLLYLHLTVFSVGNDSNPVSSGSIVFICPLSTQSIFCFPHSALLTNYHQLPFVILTVFKIKVFSKQSCIYVLVYFI